MVIQLFDAQNIHEMPSLKNEDARYVKAFFTPYMQKGSTYFIQNIDTEVKLLLVDDLLLPITINNEEYNNAYVSSLYTHYITYSLEELYLLQQPLLEKILTKIVRSVGSYLKRNQINRVVYVNNWLFSTNLYSELSEQQIDAIKQFFIQHYPEHLLVFRSLSDILNKQLIANCQSCGFQTLASRQVYIAKRYEELPKKSFAQIKQDLRQLTLKGYIVMENLPATDEVFHKISELYEKLYINKYSRSNPQFTKAFYKHTLTNHLVKYIGIEKDGELVGVIGYWSCNGMMTTPILGYDVELGKESALYRILTALIYEECEKYQLIGHRSSGAAQFKEKRGAIPSIEYSLLYAKHLPRKRRRAITLLRFICNKIGIPLLQNKKL